MILAMLLAAAAPTAIDAEREFARRAQTEGMWTAFRATAAEDALMFLPQPSRAHDFLKDRKDPLLSYMWWPADAYLSCDGKTAVTTAPAVRGAYRGYFTTVWVRQPDGAWKWVLDHGDAVAAARPAGETVRLHKPRCSGRKAAPGAAAGGDGKTSGGGASPDNSLAWNWTVAQDGSRIFRVTQWDGSDHKLVLDNQVSAAQ